MSGDRIVEWTVSCGLLGLRFAPVLAFAPPFSLIRMPALFRLLLGLGLAVNFVSVAQYPADLGALSTFAILSAASRELLLGIVIMLAFQLTFGALYFAGRVLDIQAGYAFALLIDPTSRSQTPLVGTIFVYAAGMFFFAVGGHIQLIRLFSASLRAFPVGGYHLPDSVGSIMMFMSSSFAAAIGVAGVAILCLFMIDAALAMLARTVPQMNVLILGIQVKTLALLLVLPISIGTSGALLAHIVANVLLVLPGLM